jgi:aconitate hydratase 2/2-methylisocitrate dehydratase
LSAVAGDPVQEVFSGSCMTNIGQFRAAGRILDKGGVTPARIWITPPTKMDAAQLKREGYYAIFAAAGGRTELPGCSLCMGNQARVGAGTTVFATSTRNFDHRMGDNARVYLGSSELAAVAALEGKLPTVEEYLAVMSEKVLPKAAEIYRYLEFDKMGDFSLGYVR